VKNKPQLGRGIYTLSDISNILHLPNSRIRYWVNVFWDDKLSKVSEMKYSWGEKQDKAVDFHTLIEFYTFYKLRELGISTNKILKAHSVISESLKTNFPFASSRILTDGNSILFSPDIQTIINADETLQYNLKEVIEPFCKKIDFNSNSLAYKFWPLGKKNSIVVDPHHQFGQPIIKGTNILAETLYRMNKAGESIEFIAKLYELKPKNVKDSINYFNKLAA